MRGWIGSLGLLCAVQAHAEPWEATLTLEAARSAVVYAYRAGFVRAVTVEVGDQVTTGDTLAWLQDEDLRLQAESVRLAVQKAESHLSRFRRLHAQGGVSDLELEKLDIEAQSAGIRWQQVQLDLGRTVLIATMDGIVAERHIAPGMATSARMEAFRIIDPQDLKAELFIPADRLSGIRKGQEVTARSSIQEQPLEGLLLRLSPIVDPDSGTCRAVALFEQAGHRLRPGSVVRVRMGQ